MYSLIEPNTTAAAIAVFIGASLLHASFQLSASVMTLLSGHALGHKRSHARLLHLCTSYIGGNVTVIALLLFGALYLINATYLSQMTIWASLSAIGIITGLATIIFYHPKKSDRLWIPQSAAEYLYERSKKTKNGFESFGLGMITGIAELPFIAAPLLFAAMILRGNPDYSRVGAVVVYAFIACLSLLVIFALIGSGKRVSQLEQWRERNRYFLQLTSGLGLFALSLYVFVMFYATELGKYS